MKSMRDAKGEKDVIALGRDNWQFPQDWSLLCDGYHVYLSKQAMSEKLYEFKFFDGQTFRGRGRDERDALTRLGLGAYNPVAYKAKELEITDPADGALRLARHDPQQ